MVAMLKAFAICVSLAFPHLKRKKAQIDLTPHCSYPRSNTSLSHEKRKQQRGLSYMAFLLEIGLFMPSRILGQR